MCSDFTLYTSFVAQYLLRLIHTVCFIQCTLNTTFNAQHTLHSMQTVHYNKYTVYTMHTIPYIQCKWHTTYCSLLSVNWRLSSDFAMQQNQCSGTGTGPIQRKNPGLALIQICLASFDNCNKKFTIYLSSYLVKFRPLESQKDSLWFTSFIV